MDYLLKTEPSVYSFSDLEREKITIWDGVTNPTAVKHLREMKPGDRLVIYHTGEEKSAVGTASRRTNCSQILLWCGRDV
jgi:predicted RNA-binding protein with PUA-like domain